MKIFGHYFTNRRPNIDQTHVGVVVLRHNLLQGAFLVGDWQLQLDVIFFYCSPRHAYFSLQLDHPFFVVNFPCLPYPSTRSLNLENLCITLCFRLYRSCLPTQSFYFYVISWICYILFDLAIVFYFVLKIWSSLFHVL